MDPKNISLAQVSSNKSHGGYQKVFKHQSDVLGCEMKFGIFLPSNDENKKLPVIYWLSGLTCTEQNFITKAGAQQYASKHEVIVVNPDTSPRGVNIFGENDSYDFGSGAGFYVDATQEPWNTHYKMYSYVTKELPKIIIEHFPSDPERQSIMGHSMGGHGALVCYLRNPGLYKSVSTFSAICNPSQCPWGVKAFSGYLGEDRDLWREYDATCLVTKPHLPPVAILLDQGSADEFLSSGQLLPNNLVEACKEAELPVILKKREGYDHSYFYIATYLGEHFDFHMTFLKSQ